MPPLDLYPAYLIYIFKRAWCGGAVLIRNAKVAQSQGGYKKNRLTQIDVNLHQPMSTEINLYGGILFENDDFIGSV